MWQSVEAAIERDLLRKRNVTGVGVGKKVVGGVRTDEACVVVFVKRKLPRSKVRRRDLVPPHVGSVPTDVLETGRIVAFPYTSRYRPAPGGVSIGHYRITAGTLGAVVRRDGQRVILSNNHVLANSNNAVVGDAILQPGPVDGGLMADRIATLEEFVRIHFDPGFLERILNFFRWLFGIPIPPTPDNYVDAAIARPLSDGHVADEILDIGLVAGVAEASIDMPVQKTGRTTMHTQGTVLAIHATVRVNYGDGKVAVFKDQLVTGPMSAGGDSGSLVVDMDRRAVGLLFAGSSTVTICNRIARVVDALRIGF